MNEIESLESDIKKLDEIYKTATTIKAHVTGDLYAYINNLVDITDRIKTEFRGAIVKKEIAEEAEEAQCSTCKDKNTCKNYRRNN
jgi:hypothetical protein